VTSLTIGAYVSFWWAMSEVLLFLLMPHVFAFQERDA
jgi:hypothetical protein